MNHIKYDFVIVGGGVIGLTLSIELIKMIFTELLIMNPK
jgi:L-2-hydroxyglutarate oxidase LhgO